MMLTGSVLIQAREARGWRQQDAADAIGISKRQLQRLEAKRDEIACHDLTRKAIEQALGVSAHKKYPGSVV